jgi:outer membrane protein assembly factor BamE
MRYIFSLRYLLVLFALLCTACGTALPTVKPYKLDVQQGNVVTSKMLLQLRPGMTKSQVRFIMGTPLIQDSFHGNRWDYVYQLREKGKIVEQRRVILDFENELLKAVRGDVIPAGSGPKEAETANTGTRTVQPVDKAKDKSFMDKLKFWKKDEVPPAAVTPAVVVPADNASKPQQSEPQPVPDVAPQPETSSPASAPVPFEAPSAEQPAAPASQEPAPAAEESKSLLSIPMEVQPAPADPAPVSEPTPAAPVPPVQAEPAPADVAPAPSASEPSSSPAPEPQAPYEPATGMQFDRNLKLESEAQPATAAPEPKAATSAPVPRAGNQNAPAPKDLPAEGEPDFFERMLEKIGF